MRAILTRLGSDSRYVLLTFPVAVIGSVLLTIGTALGLGTAILGVVAVGVMYATLNVARALAEVERRALPQVLGHELPRAPYRPPRAKANWFRRLWHPATQMQSWLDLLHGILILPISVVSFGVVVGWWSAAIYGLLYPLFGWVLERIPGYTALPELLDIGDGAGTSLLFHLTMGVVAAVTLPFAARAAALLRAGVGRALLTGLAEFRQFEPAYERPAVEPPQAREPDPATAATLASAMAHARQRLDEPPPCVTSAGGDLVESLRTLAESACLPVKLDLTAKRRYPEPVESAVSAVVAAALANVAEHTEARQIVISLREEAGVLYLLVADDGAGSTEGEAGPGLAELADRVKTLHGTLTVQSPTGGPTVVGARLPLRVAATPHIG